MKLKRKLITDEDNGIVKDREVDLYQDGNYNELLMGFKKAVDKYNTSVVLLFDGRSGMGKCCIKGTKVLMANGEWKKIEDIKVGEEVISPQQDGSFVKAKVTGTHNRFEPEIYDVCEMERDRKILYSCAWNHDIPFFRTESHRIGNEKRSYKQKFEIREARDLAKMKKGYATSFTTTAVDYGNENSLIEPYSLGAWIGDGHFSNNDISITSATPEILEYISKYYTIRNMIIDKRSKGKCARYDFSINEEFAKQLLRLNLNDKGSEHKFIPKECLLSSIDYRMKLLAGLIDTDGGIEKYNAIIYTTKSKQLAEDIKNLVFSLGGHSKVREIRKKAQGWKENKLYYAVKISFKDPIQIPLLTDKKKRLKKMKTDPRHIKIELKKGKPTEIYGIEIDSPSKWHVTDNWMITHNTTLANQTGLTLDENFGLKKIHFSPKTFLEGGNGKIGLANAKKGDFILFDEAMIISNRSAMSQINKMIIQSMSMIRSKNIYVGFCVNSIFDLDKNLVLHRADALFHVYGETLVSRGRFCSFFKGKDGQDRLKELFLYGKKYYSYGKPKANFVASFTREFIVDENNYEEQKQQGINEFLIGKEPRNIKALDKEKVVVYLKKKGFPTMEIAEIVSLQVRQVQRYIEKYQESLN